MNERIIKYPRTPHLNGSRLQKGDEDLSQVPFSAIKDRYIVIEEKIDGANVAVSFSSEGDLLLQSRGHFLKGGYRERHYDLFKIWANENMDLLFSILDTRYIMYGEWMYAKHKVYYDALPDFFMEFDILDRETGKFLSTDQRKEKLQGTGICSVPVLGEGIYQSQKQVLSLLGRSLYITDNHLEALKEEAEKLGLDYENVLRETDRSDLAEGLYIKVEENGEVVDRMKFVRLSYTQGIEVAESRQEWLAKPIVRNKLMPK
ncbi:MAG: RNA ligase family protein [Clostridia bacterium]|nr:RNA ligase family protein [Clostridia bacterium]